MMELIKRIRPTAIIIAVLLCILAGYLVFKEVDYAEGVVGVIVGALAGSFDKLLKDSGE